MSKWMPVPIEAPLFTNVKESVLRKASAAIENAFINEAGGHSRFPGLRGFVTLSGKAPTFLGEWRGDMVAESQSRVYRINRAGTARDVTGAPVSGEGRTMFTKTDNELVLTKGGPIVRLAGDETELLSRDAPNATHTAYIDRYLVANETGTGLFQHSEVGEYRTWNALDTFAADGNPDNISALIVTPFRELISAGPSSIEQFERLTSGSIPFFRRWSVGLGVKAPYTVVAEDQGVWAVNERTEFARYTGQTSAPHSEAISRSLEGVDDWTLAWAASVQVSGQKFILLQAPRATNTYGTKGLTFLFDYRSKKWAQLYGWDAKAVLPARWPGWSYLRLWDRNFVGGDGKVFELTEDVHTNDGATQRMLGRTAHIDKWGESRIEDVRVRVKRGIAAQNATVPRFGLRCMRDASAHTRWNYKSLGGPGENDMILYYGAMGWARTWQFEWMATEDCEIELVSMEALVTSTGR